MKHSVRYSVNGGRSAGRRRHKPLLDVGGDAEVAGAQLAGHLFDLQLDCKGRG